jgi:WD40 repeat protein
VLKPKGAIICALVIFFGFTSHAQVKAASDCGKWSESQTPIEVQSRVQAEEDAGVISSFRWIPDSACIVVGQIDGLWLYNIHNVENPVKLVDTQNVRDIAVSSDGERIAFTLDDHPTAYVLTAPDVVSPIETPKQAITAITFSPDGKTLAIAGADKVQVETLWLYSDRQVYIWDLNRNEEIVEFPTSDNYQSEFVGEMFFDPNGSHLLIHILYQQIAEGTNIQYWDVASQRLLWDWYTIFDKKRNPEYDPVAVFVVKMQNKLLVTGGLYGYMNYDEYYGSGLFVYRELEDDPLRTTEIVIGKRGSPDYTSFSAFTINQAATLIASINSNGLIQLWDVSSGEELTQFETPYTAAGDLSFNDDDKFLAMRVFAEDRQDIVVWDVQTQAKVAVIEGHLDEK